MNGYFADVAGILFPLLRVTPQGDGIIWTGSNEFRAPAGAWILFSDDGVAAFNDEQV